jgi:hypothetical protein
MSQQIGEKTRRSRQQINVDFQTSLTTALHSEFPFSASKELAIDTHRQLLNRLVCLGQNWPAVMIIGRRSQYYLLLVALFSAKACHLINE